MDIRAVGLDNTRKGGAQLVVLTLPSGVMCDSKIDPALAKVDKDSESAHKQTSEMNFVLQQVMYGYAPAAAHLCGLLKGWRCLTCGLCLCSDLVDKKEGTLLLMCKKPSLLYQALAELEENVPCANLNIYSEQPLKIVAADDAKDGAVSVPGGIHQDPTFGEAYYCIIAYHAERTTKPGTVGLCKYMEKLPPWFGDTVQEEQGTLLVHGEVPPCNVANSYTNIHTNTHTYQPPE
jgi:hypothetical protein